MTKKCMICDGAEAAYCIKGTSDFYCEACAVDSFGDVALLVKVEDEAKRLKDIIDDKLAGDKEDQQEK